MTLPDSRIDRTGNALRLTHGTPERRIRRCRTPTPTHCASAGSLECRVGSISGSARPSTTRSPPIGPSLAPHAVFRRCVTSPRRGTGSAREVGGRYWVRSWAPFTRRPGQHPSTGGGEQVGLVGAATLALMTAGCPSGSQNSPDGTITAADGAINEGNFQRRLRFHRRAGQAEPCLLRLHLRGGHGKRSIRPRSGRR